MLPAKPILGFLVLATSLACCTTVPNRVDGAEGQPPNVLYLISDDQAWTDFGFMGHPVVRPRTSIS